MPIAIVLGAAALFMLWERLRPGTVLPHVPGFYLRAIALNAMQVVAIVVAGWTWEGWLQGPSLVATSRHLGPIAAGLVGYVVSTFVYYWWHRARHRWTWLWRSCHQIHHSPARLEVVTAFYKHPLEQLANTVVSATVAYPLLGLSPAAAAVFTVCAGLAELVYHVNIDTPRWLGWFIQRPEMHRIHHERGRHAGNYGDLPLWDMLFGTYHNPERFDGPCGFDDDRERRLGEMLHFRDVHEVADRPRRRWRQTWGLGALLAVGVSHPLGATLDLGGGPPAWAKAIQAPGQLLLASPAPKVFCRRGDFEPFAYRHDVTVVGGATTETFALDRVRYGQLEGPYALRNVYGAALVFGPLMPAETTEGVLHHGLCTPGRLLPDASPPDRVTISSAPAGRAMGTPFTQTIVCRDGDAS